MVQALYFAVLLAMLLCFASGQDFSIDCPKPMNLATQGYYVTGTITCTFKKSAFTAVCNGGALPTQVQFHLTNSQGSKLPWCYAPASSCPSSGTVQSTGSSLPSSCGCVSDDGTYMTFTMTIYPSLDLLGSTFTCEATCLTTGTLPTLVDNDNKCTNMEVENPQLCENGEYWDETECSTSAFYILCWVFLALLLLLLFFFIVHVVNIYVNWIDLKSPLWTARILDKILNKCGCVKTPDSSRPMQPNTVRPEEGSSAHLSTSRRELPVPSTKQPTAAPRLDPIDHGKTNMATDETNPGGQLFPKKLAPISSGINA